MAAPVAVRPNVGRNSAMNTTARRPAKGLGATCLGLMFATFGCADDIGQTTDSTTDVGTTMAPDSTSDTPGTTGPAPGTSTGEPEPSTSGGPVADGTSSTGDSAPAGTGCCEAHAGAGCDEPEIQACVCAVEVGCCAFDWDFACVTIAENECGGCGATGTSSTGGSSTGSSSEDSDTDGGLVCCETSAMPGCPDREVETCVCAIDNFCCQFEWDQTCVELTEFCGLDCPSESSTGDAGDGDCCAVHNNVGCDDEAVENCVCAMDPFCCQVMWDGICVNEAINLCDADCGAGSTSFGTDTSMDTGSMDTGDPGTSCCVPHGTPGCDDAVVEACVCAFDSFCCDASWDNICVSEALDPCGAVCEGDTEGGVSTSTGLVSSSDAGSGGNPGDCCVSNPTPGCGDPEVESCVCLLDPFCCEIEWDGICVGEALDPCGAVC
jgi:hypothetical protein